MTEFIRKLNNNSALMLLIKNGVKIVKVMSNLNEAADGGWYGATVYAAGTCSEDRKHQTGCSGRELSRAELIKQKQHWPKLSKSLLFNY